MDDEEDDDDDDEEEEEEDDDDDDAAAGVDVWATLSSATTCGCCSWLDSVLASTEFSEKAPCS